MQHSYIDEHSGIDSFIHRLEPRVKVISFFIFIIFIITTELKGAYPGRSVSGYSFVPFLLYGLFLLILILFSKIPLDYVLRRSLAIIPFALAVIIFIPFFTTDKTGAAYKLGTLKLSLNPEGWITFLHYLLRSYLSILAMVLLTSSTRFSDLLKALEKLRFPLIFIMVVSFMYRYLFVFRDELMSMRQAKEARSFKAYGWLKFQALANMVGVLFVRAYERAENVYLAMCSRGFDGRIKTLYNFQIRPSDIYFLLITLFILAGIRTFGV